MGEPTWQVTVSGSGGSTQDPRTARLHLLHDPGADDVQPVQHPQGPARDGDLLLRERD